MAGYKTLAFAVGLGTVGYVLLEDGKLIDWGMSPKAHKTTKATTALAAEVIRLHKPELVLTEATQKGCRKGLQSKSNIEAIAQQAQKMNVLNATVTRTQRCSNRYEEARGLINRYPELQRLSAAKPPIWVSAPRRMIVFETLSMALQVR